MLLAPDYIDGVMTQNGRSVTVVCNLAHLYRHGRFGGRTVDPARRPGCREHPGRLASLPTPITSNPPTSAS